MPVESGFCGDWNVLVHADEDGAMATLIRGANEMLVVVMRSMRLLSLMTTATWTFIWLINRVRTDNRFCTHLCNIVAPLVSMEQFEMF